MGQVKLDGSNWKAPISQKKFFFVDIVLVYTFCFFFS